MSRYRCGACGRESTDPGEPGLDPRYRFGLCNKLTGGCGRKSQHVVVDGELLKQGGMDAATRTSEPSGWVARFDAELERRAAAGTTFTSEDVTHAVGQPPSSGAVGARINAAARRGLIEHVGYTKARRANQHGAELRTWRGVRR